MEIVVATSIFDGIQLFSTYVGIKYFGTTDATQLPKIGCDNRKRKYYLGNDVSIRQTREESI